MINDFETVASFKKRANISVATSTLEAEAVALGLHTRVKRTSKLEYQSLDKLLVPLNTYCEINPQLVKETCSVGLAQHLYLLKLYNNDKFIGHCKVGIAKDVDERCKDLNRAWKSVGIVFKPHKITDKILDALTLESAIHTILRHKNLESKGQHKFDGHTELFVYKEWIDNLV